MANRCEYEQWPIASVKIRPGKPDELVIPAEPFREQVGIGDGTSNSSVGRILRGVCDYCGLCKPRIEIKAEEYRIYRTDYRPLSEGRSRDPFYTVEYRNNFYYKNGNDIRVTVIDDRDVGIIGDSLNDRGFPAMLVDINPEREPPRLAVNQLLGEIFSFGPRVVIADKGLGWWSGPDLIKALREKSCGAIKTIMHTGEWQTGETRSVADRFLQKPASIEVIESTIRSLLR